MASWKIAPAMAWGNTCVIKPSEDTPASVTMLGRLATEACLPPGVLNVLNGHGTPAGFVVGRRPPRGPRDVHRFLDHGQARHGIGCEPPRPGFPRTGDLPADHATREHIDHQRRGHPAGEIRVLPSNTNEHDQ
jgi:hypothetical protein